MKNFENAKRLTTTTLMALACAGFVGCTGQSDRAVVTTDTTTSNTTLAADDTPKTMDTTGEVPPAAADATEAKTMEKSSTTSETKSSKHMKHKAKKAHKKSHDAAVWTAPDDSYVVNEDDSLLDNEYAYDDDAGSMDVSNQYEDTVSGTTMAPEVYRETGLSPFAQEPNSRFPVQIGSGQLTGEDKSTTIFDGPSLFQDPSALGRDLIH